MRYLWPATFHFAVNIFSGFAPSTHTSAGQAAFFGVKYIYQHLLDTVHSKLHGYELEQAVKRTDVKVKGKAEIHSVHTAVLLEATSQWCMVKNDRNDCGKTLRGLEGRASVTSRELT